MQTHGRNRGQGDDVSIDRCLLEPLFFFFLTRPTCHTDGVLLLLLLLRAHMVGGEGGADTTWHIHYAPRKILADFDIVSLYIYLNL